jgi:hypothetical protein
MSKLKIGPIEDDKPVTMTIKLSAGVHRDLIAHAEALQRVPVIVGHSLRA